MKNSIELYIQHPTDWEQSEYVMVDYFIIYDGFDIDDLGIDNWKSEEHTEWITEDLVFNELLNQIKKQNEQPN